MNTFGRTSALCGVILCGMAGVADAARQIEAGCMFRPSYVSFECDEEAVTELTVEVTSQGRPVPGADVIVEGGGCSTRYEDVIRGTTDSRGIFGARCTFGLQRGACDTYADGSPELVSPAHVTVTAPGHGDAYTQCQWVAKVPHR